MELWLILCYMLQVINYKKSYNRLLRVTKSKMKITRVQQKQIKKLTKKYPIKVIYIFGSQVTGKIGPLSDYDFAVILDKKVDPDKYYHLNIKILCDFNSIMHSDRVDVVILNRTNSILAMKIISDGLILISTDEIQRIAFEAKTIAHYQDRSYYEERYNKAMFRQIILRGV